jgi:hypothetical protein
MINMVEKEIPFPIALRHDLDTKLCTSYLPEMIDTERKAEIRSTIFIRVDAVLNYNYLLELQDEGWEFGLHISSSIHKVIHSQLEYLRALGFNVIGASMCGSFDFIGRRWGWLNSEQNYCDWITLNSLELDYICGFGEVPPEVTTTVFENGCFTLDNYYVATYGRKAMRYLLEDMKFYQEKVDPPVYPLLVHPINLFRPKIISPFPLRLYNKYLVYRYLWRQLFQVFNIKTSIGIFKKVVKMFAPAMFRYKDILPLLSTNRGFVNSPLGYRTYNDIIPSKLRKDLYNIK